MSAPRTLPSLLLFCLILLLLVACSAGSPAPAPTMPASPGAGARPVTFLLWYSWPPREQRALALLVERFNRTHPQIQIIPQARPVASLVQELRLGALEGSGPHLALIQSHSLGQLAESQVLLPLDDLVSPADRERLLPAALGSAQVAGSDGTPRLYGMPLAFDTLALYYNKANIEVPPADTDALLRTARGLTDATTDPPIWGLAYNLSLDHTIGYLYAFGGQIFDEQGALVLGTSGRAGVERWLEWLLELRQDPEILAVGDGITIANTLMAREALMTVDWAHTLPGYRDLWADGLGVAPLPRLSGDERPPQPYLQSDLIAINARVVSADEQRAALEFIRFLLTVDSQRELLAVGKQPTVLDLDLSGDNPDLELARAFREQALTSLPMPNSTLAREVVWETLRLMQLNVLRGLATPADAVSVADAALRQRLEPPAP